MKRLISVMLIATLLLSMTACAENAQHVSMQTIPTVTETIQPAEVTEETEVPPTEKNSPESYVAEGLRYPSVFGEAILGKEAARGLYGTMPFFLATQNINNVGDALHYLKAMANAGITYDLPYDICTLFTQLVAGDYEEVGLINLVQADNGYTLAYILQEGCYFPFDVFTWYHNSRYIWPKYKAYCDFTEMEALGNALMKSYPYNLDNAPITEWVAETVGTYRSQEEREFLLYLTTPQYTQEQLEQWVSEDLTLEQWAEKITVPADAIAALKALGYSVDHFDNVVFTQQGTIWGGVWNAQKVFDMGGGRCGGTSHIINALLAGDFDEQGYVAYNGNNGGHIFNYFLKDGMYAMCDFVDLFAQTRLYIDQEDLAFVVYLGTDLQEFADNYMSRPNHNDPEGSEYIYHLFMYAREGASYPKGKDAKSPPTKFNNWIIDVLPEEYREEYVFLYEREGYPIRYKPIQAPDSWPEVLR